MILAETGILFPLFTFCQMLEGISSWSRPLINIEDTRPNIKKFRTSLIYFLNNMLSNLIWIGKDIYNTYCLLNIFFIDIIWAATISTIAVIETTNCTCWEKELHFHCIYNFMQWYWSHLWSQVYIEMLSDNIMFISTICNFSFVYKLLSLTKQYRSKLQKMPLLSKLQIGI